MLIELSEKLTFVVLILQQIKRFSTWIKLEQQLHGIKQFFSVKTSTQFQYDEHFITPHKEKCCVYYPDPSTSNERKQKRSLSSGLFEEHIVIAIFKSKTM